MFGLLAELIATKKIKFEDGRIELIEEPVSIIPLDCIVTLQKKLEETGQDNEIYYASKNMGVRWFKHMYEHFDISYEEVIRWGIKILSLAGWGKTKVPKFNSHQEYYTVRLESSGQSRLYGKSNHPVDNFVRGCYASGAKVLFGKECEAIELKCIAQGHKYCEFIAQPREKFDLSDPMIERQLDLGIK